MSFFSKLTFRKSAKVTCDGDPEEDAGEPAGAKRAIEVSDESDESKDHRGSTAYTDVQVFETLPPSPENRTKHSTPEKDDPARSESKTSFGGEFPPIFPDSDEDPDEDGTPTKEARPSFSTSLKPLRTDAAPPNRDILTRSGSGEERPRTSKPKGGTVVDMGMWDQSSMSVSSHRQPLAPLHQKERIPAGASYQDHKDGDDAASPSAPAGSSHLSTNEEALTSGEKSIEDQEDDRALLQGQALFGDVLLYKLTSSKWGERKEAIVGTQHATEDHLSSLRVRPGDPLSSDVLDDVRVRFVVVCSIVKRALKDRVAPVCFAAFEALRTLLSAYVQYFDENSEEVVGSLQRLVPILIEKMNGEATGTNRRMQQDALACIMRLTDATSIGGQHLIASFLSDETRPLRPRLRLLKDFLEKFGLNKSSALRLSMVMAVAVPALHIADDKTRKAAVAVVEAAYVILGTRVQKHLSSSSIKPAMLKILNRKFAELDQKNTPAEAEGLAVTGSRVTAGSSYLAPLAPLGPKGGGVVGVGRQQQLPALSSSSPPEMIPKKREIRKTGSYGSAISHEDEDLMDSIVRQ